MKFFLSSWFGASGRSTGLQVELAKFSWCSRRYCIGLCEKYVSQNIAQTAFAGTQIKAAMEAKKELDNQKEEAERILAAQEKHTQEEIAFAQDVLRKYPVEYRRLTAEDIKSQNFAGGGLAGLNAFKAGGRPSVLKGWR
jgi:hypothetical protein